MKLFCSKCEKPVENPDKVEVVDGYLLSCPECDGPVGFLPYEEAHNMAQNILMAAVLGILPSQDPEEPAGCPSGTSCGCKQKDDTTKAPPLFTADEAIYLTHLVDKQLEKVSNAARQLVNIKTKIGGYTHD